MRARWIFTAHKVVRERKVVNRQIGFGWKKYSSKSGLKTNPSLPSLAAQLQLERKIFRRAQFRKLALSVLFVPIVFASLLLAVSQSLHEKLHQDASKPSHQCAITLFAQQQILASEPTIILVELNPGLVVPIAVSDSTIFSSVDYRFSASRAPPFPLL